MAHFVIENFSNGMDTRRSADTAPSGSLRVLTNAFINPGGEIEKRKSFSQMPTVEAYTMDAANKGSIAGPFLTPSGDFSVMFMNSDGPLYTDANFTADNAICSSARVTESDEERLEVLTTVQDEAALDPASVLRHISAGPASFGTAGQQYIGEFSGGLRDFSDYPIHLDYDGNGRTSLSVEYLASNFNYESIFVQDGKGYATNRFSLFASSIGDITDWAGLGSGEVNVNKLSGTPIGVLIALSEYYGQLAVFGRNAMQLWDTDPDFDLNQYRRTIPMRLVSARSVTPYANEDILYLDRSGVRSIRSRELSGDAEISDVGSPIDELIETKLDYQTGADEDVLGKDYKPAEFATLAIGAVLEDLGQFWLFLLDKVYVLSNFPDAKVRAWSIYDLPAPTVPNPDFSDNINKYVADVAQVNGTLMFRNFGDNVWLYGGTTSGKYDSAPVEVITPHMDFGRPGSEKEFNGIDVACIGTWLIEVSFDVNNVIWEEVATVTNSTHRLTGRLGFEGRSTHIAVRMTTTSALQAKVGQMTIYYDDGGER